eukprot:2406854-Amphidinium_carterae.1
MENVQLLVPTLHIPMPTKHMACQDIKNLGVQLEVTAILMSKATFWCSLSGSVVREFASFLYCVCHRMVWSWHIASVF